MTPTTFDFTHVLADITPLTTEELDILNRRARPGRWSEGGFMSAFEDVVELSKADAAVLQRLNVTHKQIGDRLDAVIARARRLRCEAAYPGTAVIDGHIKVPPYVSTMGHQECLFGKDWSDTCGKGSSLITIVNDQMPDQPLTNVTELHGHLVREHHFFQGNTSFRLDPELAVRVLGIVPGVSYEAEFHPFGEWRQQGSSQHVSAETVQKIKEGATQTWDLGDNVGTAYLCPFGDPAMFWGDTTETLHLFVGKATEPVTIDVGGAMLNTEWINPKQYCTFERRARTEVVLGADDRFEVDLTASN